MTKLRPMLRAYVLTVLAIGLACFGWAAATIQVPDGRLMPPLAILFAIAVLAQTRPIHVSAKVKFTVEDVATFATLIVYGPAIAALLGITSKLASWRPGRGPLWNLGFNASKLGVSLAAGGFVYQTFAAFDEPGLVVVGLLLAGVTKNAVESSFVELAVSLQMRRRPFASWLRLHQRELPLEFALYAFGALGATTILINPWAIVLFAVPMVVIGWALNETTRLSQQTSSAIFTLADLVDARDPFTHGHSVRVAANAERLAKRLKLQQAQVDLIRTAARVHDIGKAATDDHVLLKAGPLETHELAHMQAHTDYGATLLAALPEFFEGAELVRAHHERVDGLGYPRGLRGQEIPLEVGVVAVPDAYDAMVNDRPYRKAMSWEQARAELLSGRGTQWEARIVDAFVAMIEEERAAQQIQPIGIPQLAG